MAITSYSFSREGTLTVVTVVSSLSPPVIYHWYADGSYVGRTQFPKKSFMLEPGEQLRVEVLDTTDANFDPITNAPPGYPARRTLRWYPSSGNLIRVDQEKSGGPTIELGRFPRGNADPQSHMLITPRLDDLGVYTWSMTPYDLFNNSGIGTGIGPEKIVRWPDAPRWSFTFDAGTTRVTFQAA